VEDSRPAHNVETLPSTAWNKLLLHQLCTAGITV